MYYKVPIQFITNSTINEYVLLGTGHYLLYLRTIHFQCGGGNVFMFFSARKRSPKLLWETSDHYKNARKKRPPPKSLGQNVHPHYHPEKRSTPVNYPGKKSTPSFRYSPPLHVKDEPHWRLHTHQKLQGGSLR